MELYIELPARRHFGHALFGAPINQAALEEVKPAVEKGLAALKQLAGSGPWLGGASFSLLDIYAYYTFGYAGMVLNKVYQWDILAEVPDVAAILDKVKARDAFKLFSPELQADVSLRIGSDKIESLRQEAVDEWLTALSR